MTSAYPNNIVEPARSPRTVLRCLVVDDEPSALDEELQRRSASVNIKIDGLSLLHVALSVLADKTAKWLITARIDPNVSDEGGLTPLHYVSGDGNIDILEALLTASADVSACTVDRLVRLGRMPMYECGGRTPLHVAKSVDVVQKLLDAAADVNVRDMDGNTPWDVALREGNKPRTDVAKAMRPDAIIPDLETIQEAKRADYRARQERLTLTDAKQRLMEEADLIDVMGSDYHSGNEDDGETVASVFSNFPAAAPVATSVPKPSSATPWYFSSKSGHEDLIADMGPNSYRIVHGAHLWRTNREFPAKAASPFSEACVLHSKIASQAVAGTDDPPPLQPAEVSHAWNYCGHQLGKFSGQLGDGACVGARLGNGLWEVCWKGCGRTPFSRLGTSGRKRVSSCVRELLLSEAMALLGVPSQRGLAVFVVPSLLDKTGLVSKGPAAHVQGLAERNPIFLVSKAWCSNCKATKKIFEDLDVIYESLELEDADRKALVRDPEVYLDALESSTGARTVPRVFVGGDFLGGREDTEALHRSGKLKAMVEKCGALRSMAAASANVSEESGSGSAVLVRACPGVGMIRFGTFEIANGPELDPHNRRAGPSAGNSDLIARLVAFTGETSAKALLQKACQASASLVAKWAALGLVHGMLNTDNVHIAGITIDAAGFCFMTTYYSGYDADGPSAARGRYSYGNQASAMFWNLKCLAASLSRGGQQIRAEDAESIVSAFPRLYRAAWLCEMRKKLGLVASTGGKQARADIMLINSLFHVMETTYADFTSTFRCLMPPLPANGEEMLSRLVASRTPLLSTPARADELRRRASRIRPSEPRELLQKLEADEEVKDRVARRLAQHDEADRLEQMASETCELTSQHAQDVAAWDAWISAYAEHCSTYGGPDALAMAKANPKFVPRPWVVEAAAIAAESGDFVLAQRVLDLLPRAFDEATDFGDLGGAAAAT